MADNTPVNAQITDAVTQSNVNVVGGAPAQALSMLYQVASHSAGLSMQNAVASQQALNQLSDAVIAKAVAQIMSISDTPAAAKA
jgi:hypothetical protein